MNIIIFGAAGDVGQAIVSEAISRDHKVTAVVRREAQLTMFAKNVDVVLGDANDPSQIEALAAGHDHIISALRPATGQEQLLPVLTNNVLAAAFNLKVKSLVVGGAARLKMPDDSGYTVLTAPGFLPDGVVDIAKACFEQYQGCLESNNTNWLYATPPAMLQPGTRTGNYRLGDDTLVIDENGLSAISIEDFAVAIMDTLANPVSYPRSFTAAY